MSNKPNSDRAVYFALALGLSLFAGGCAGSPKGGNLDANLIKMPAPGKARVVFVRTGQGPTQPPFSLHDGGRFIGTLPAKGCLIYESDPGPHAFSASWENVALLDAQLLADRVYYVEVRREHGFVMAAVGMYALRPKHSGWSKLPKRLAAVRETTVNAVPTGVGVQARESHLERLAKNREKYLKDRDREQVLPGYGQVKPVGAP
jgi:hypothetical protein